MAINGLDNVVKSNPDSIPLSVRGGEGTLRAYLNNTIGEIAPEVETYTRVRSITHRPWGCFETLYEGNGRKVKRVLVNTAQKLSLQKHFHRCEFWSIVQGVGYVTVGDSHRVLLPDETVYIPANTLHRLENRGDTILEVLEVQTGSYLEEDDIIRYEDMYGRAQKILPVKNNIAVANEEQLA